MGNDIYFLYANPQKPDTILVAGRLASLLTAQHHRVLLDTWLHELLHIGEPVELSRLGPETRVIISLGGDGTLLRTLPTAAEQGIPVLGVNMGRVGFLLEVDEPGLPAALRRIESRDYRLEERMMLSCSVNGGRESLVMNDVVLSRGADPSSIVVNAVSDGELVYATHGDGMMVSTATGSTGYCLSAGGPVLHPDLDCMVLLPICTHKAQQLPVVLSGDTHIRMHAEPVVGRTHQVVLDGQTCIEVTGAVDVGIRRAARKAQFIRFEPQQFFTRLRQKQSEWSMR
ncbi:MAG: NAD(+)/NADH kinase [Christensenellales bacterium]